MNIFLPFLAGYRTYIIAAAGVLLNGLHTVAPHLNLPIGQIDIILAFLGLGSVRAALHALVTPQK